MALSQVTIYPKYAALRDSTCYSQKDQEFVLNSNLSSAFYRVGGNRLKERDRKSELVLGSTYKNFEWDRNNLYRNFDFWETNRIAADKIF